MSQAQDASSYVFEGLWTNWSKSAANRLTLTLTPSNAIVLVSFLAIFVQLIGSQSWKLFQFAIHQLRATPDPKDGLYHQQQVVLRNNTTDLSTLFQLLRIAIAWRHQKITQSFQRSIALITWALIHFLFFGLAGTFISTILTVGDEVLSRSPFCGPYSNTYLESLQVSAQAGMPTHPVTEYRSKAQSRYQQTQQYVQFCTEPSALCDTLPKQRLHWSSKISQSCPFEASMCSETSQAISYDTGYLSSHEDLGLNAPGADRLLYRRVSACSVMKDDKFISDWKSIPESSEWPGSPAKRVVDALYGPNVLADRNATYSFSDWSQYFSFDENSDTSPYAINVQTAMAGDLTYELSDFLPIPQLNMSSADTTLIFLSFSKSYESAVSDPWFSAQNPQTYPPRNGVTTVNGTIFVRERPVTTLGCTEQHQFCTGSKPPSPTSDNCTPLMGGYQIDAYAEGVASLNLTAKQSLTYGRIAQAAADSTFYNVLHGLAQRDTPLLAEKKIQGLVGLGLPEDQWLQETEYWQNLSLTNLQRAVIEYGTGQFAANTDYINLTATPEQTWICQNLMIRNTVYESFHFLGLMLILSFGTVIIIVGMSCEDVVALWRRRQDHQGFRQDMWVRNDTLELLCEVPEGKDLTTWSHSSNGIPVSGPGQPYSMAQKHKPKHIVNPIVFKTIVSDSGTEKIAVDRIEMAHNQHGHGGYQKIDGDDTLREPSRSSYGWGVLPSSSTVSLINQV